MRYTILEENGAENSNIDGAAFNHFSARQKSGIMAGIMSECELSASSNYVTVGTGELLLCGFRVKILDSHVLYVDYSASEQTHYIIASINLSSSGYVSFSMHISSSRDVVQDNLFSSLFGSGLYEEVIATFKTDLAGARDIQRIAPIIGSDEFNSSDKVIFEGDPQSYYDLPEEVAVPESLGTYAVSIIPDDGSSDIVTSIITIGSHSFTYYGSSSWQYQDYVAYYEPYSFRISVTIGKILSVHRIR